MGIIKAMHYAVMTVFNCMPLKTFGKLCESYAYGDVSVETTLAAYIATNSLTKQHYGCSSDLNADWEQYLSGSKLEFIFQINTTKLWTLFVETVQDRHLSVPEQFILINKMPAEFFCQMYGDFVGAERINWFDDAAAKMLVLSYRENYDKLLWYVKHCKISASVLHTLTDLFSAEAVEFEKTHAREPERCICKVMREWLLAENASEEVGKSYGSMLDFVLVKQEQLQQEKEAYIRLLSYDLNTINGQY